MTAKIVITGAAGLVGQNLITRLESQGYNDIVAIDKHPTNVEALKKYHPNVRVLHTDIAERGAWEDELAGCTHLVIGHAQIGGLVHQEFIRNNVDATVLLLDAAKRNGVGYIVHISSAVVDSMANDDYTNTKKLQEKLIDAIDIQHVVLRPTLMFGWFDRKHFGWLARFMQRVPVFPVPGSGEYLRQPLYVGDFCDIIISAIKTGITGTYKITGQERTTYIKVIRAIKEATQCKTVILKIPYSAFWVLLWGNALVDKNPAFTTNQLKALIAPEEFEVIDWPQIFNVRSTPLQEALNITYRDPIYSQVALDF